MAPLVNPAHHPSDDLWLAYQGGHLHAPARTLLEAHLAFCASCRGRASSESILGAPVLMERPGETPPPGLLEAILAKAKPPMAPQVGRESLPLPQFLWSLLPDLRGATWKGALTPGFRFLEAGQGLYLVHLEKGRPFPRHGHGGVERSVVLCGGLRDGSHVLEAGDYEEVGEDRVHRPQALPDEDCWLLANLEGDLRFSGWRGWLQRFA